MKQKSDLLTKGVLLIFSVIIIILAYNLYQLNSKVQRLENQDIASLSTEATQVQFEQVDEKISRIESDLEQLLLAMPNSDLTQFVSATTLELARIEELLNKMDGIETVYGKITDLKINDEKEMTLVVEIPKQQEVVTLELTENCTFRVVGQFSLVPIETKEFVAMITQNLEDNFYDRFTFKMIGEKVVQIYQGGLQ